MQLSPTSSWWGQSKHNPRSFPHFHDVNVHQGAECNNCSFSAKRMHFGAKLEVLRRGAMGCQALQCCKLSTSTSTSKLKHRLGNCREEGCEFRGLPLMGMDLSEVTLMWYDRPSPAATLQCSKYDVIQACWQLEPRIAVSRQKYGLTAYPAPQCSPSGKSPFRF